MAKSPAVNTTLPPIVNSPEVITGTPVNFIQNNPYKSMAGAGVAGGGLMYGMGQSNSQTMGERLGLSTPPSRFGRMVGR